MKYIKTIAISLFLISLTSLPTFAQDTKVTDILGDQEINNELISELDNQEEEREDGFENQLLLKIPEQTDNPSHILTFTDPSENKDGVQLEIDSTKYVEIKSPYSLPALSIGKHILKFKFTDNQGATQILEKSLTVIPRPPVINSPQVKDNSIIISGTGLANSELILLATQGTSNITEILDIDKDGNWQYTYTSEKESDLLLNISAYTRKYGYASNLSEITTFSNGTTITKDSDSNNSSLVFSIGAFSDPIGIAKESPEFLIYSGILVILGFLLSLILTGILKKGSEEKKIKDLEQKINGNKKKSKKELTLREKLALEKDKDNVKNNNKPKKDEKKVEKKKIETKKEEKIITKENFMKDFKKFDPDNNNGKEKKVRVSLTSKNKD